MSSNGQLSQAQILAAYNARFLFARYGTRRIPGPAFKYGSTWSANTNSDPIRVTTGNFLAGVKARIHGTMAYTLPAGSAAPTLTSTGAQGLIRNLAVIGQNQVTPVSLSGQAQEIFHVLEQKADYQDTAVFGLPAANAGTASVTVNESVDVWQQYDLVQDYVDLLGIQNVNNDSLNIDVQMNFGAETDCVSLPAGATATFTGVVDLYAVRFRANKAGQPGPDFTKFFNQLAIVRGQKMDSQSVVININFKQLITRIILLVSTAANTLDSENSLGISSVSLTASSGELILGNWDLQDIINEQAKRYGPEFTANWGGKGLYALDFDLIREYIDGSAYTNLALTLEMPTTPAAGATVSAYLQGITNTFPQVPVFMVG